MENPSNETSRRYLDDKAREDMRVFIELALGWIIPDFQYEAYIGLIGAYFQAQFEGRIGGLIINTPPRHAKSRLTIAAVGYFLGINPDKKVVVISHSQRLADALSRSNKKFMESDFYRRIFPGTIIDPSKSAASEFETTRGGGRLGISFETSITGFGADWILVDDPMSAHKRSSVATREGVLESFNEMVTTRINDWGTGKFTLIAHRLHSNDLSATLERRGFEVLSLPFEAEEDGPVIFEGKAYLDRKKGEVLQPKRFPPHVVARLKSQIPNSVFAAQYQQRPVESGFLGIERSHFPIVDAVPTKGNVYIAWDTASTEGRGSYTAGLVIKRCGNTHYVIDVIRQQAGYERAVDLMIGAHHRHAPIQHIFEKAGLAQAYHGALIGNGATSILLPVSKSKEERLESQLFPITNRQVQILRSVTLRDEFLEEVTTFPYGSSDDLVDALTLYLGYVDDTGQPPSVEKVIMGFNTRKGLRKEGNTVMYGRRKLFRL
ncbi:hypothetical protein ASD50_21180 [Mesorhizobium sp. Root552]|jgi:phage terminase large subunit-like protein|nr:hypothetical protein ASD50_21180 [Mesorhizobium sp. Root552]